MSKTFLAAWACRRLNYTERASTEAEMQMPG
jgi:hypothetical protein